MKHKVPSGLEQRNLLGVCPRQVLQQEMPDQYGELIQNAGPLGAGWNTYVMQLHQMGNVMDSAFDSDVNEQRGQLLLQKSHNCGVNAPGVGRLTWEFTKEYVIPADPAATAFVGFDRLENRFIVGNELRQRHICGQTMRSVTFTQHLPALAIRFSAQEFDLTLEVRVHLNNRNALGTGVCCGYTLPCFLERAGSVIRVQANFRKESRHLFKGNQGPSRKNWNRSRSLVSPLRFHPL